MDECIVKLSIEEWSFEQRLAISRIAAQALTQTAPHLGESWSRQWWYDMLNYLQITQQQIEQQKLTIDESIAILSTEQRDIRIEAMIDILALALHITPTIMKEDAKKANAKHVMLYDARSRQFLKGFEHWLKLYPGDLCAVEKSVAQQMYYSMQEQQQQQDGSVQKNLDQSARKAIDEANNKSKALKWIATGAGIIGGGAVIALTGGLAAPLLAPLLVGVTGATFFATAGGVALVTSLFGLTGGGLAGWKMHRRMKGVEEFGFKQILTDPDLPPVPALHCTICISGFLLDSVDETKTPWIEAFEKQRSNQDVFCLEYETESLLKLGYSFRRFVKDSAINYAGMEVAKATVLNAFFAAVALPVTMLKIADVIDNPWQIVVERSKKAGEVLANVLEERVQGNRPCDLVAYSCGCLVVWHCLLELKERGKVGLVDNVVMMGAPISTEEVYEWRNAAQVVSGRFINCYTPNDWVLAFVYRLHSLATNVAGLEAVTGLGNRIENVQVDIDGHTKYPAVISEILNQVKLE